MFRRPRSPVAVVNAFALAAATLFAGAWDSGGHGHGAVAEGNAYCVIDHQVEVTATSSRATVGNAAAPHEHSCVACQLGSSNGVAEPGKAVTGRVDRASTPLASRSSESRRNGESWQYTVRGPPRG